MFVSTDFGRWLLFEKISTDANDHADKMNRIKQIYNVNNNIPSVTSYQDLLRKPADCNMTLDGRINELHALVN
jgi:hypothetical protein